MELARKGRPYKCKDRNTELTEDYDGNVTMVRGLNDLFIPIIRACECPLFQGVRSEC